MKRYLASLQSFARPKIVFILFVLFLGIYALLNYTYLPFSIPSLQEASGGKTILNVLPHYDAEGAYDHISSYSQTGVRIYHRILLIDIFFLIPIYLLFLTAGLLHAGLLVVQHRSKAFLHILALLPTAAGILNLLEDGIITYLIEAYPSRYDAIATLCGYITSAKSLFITVSLLAIAILYLLIGYSRIAYSAGLRKCHI